MAPRPHAPEDHSVRLQLLLAALVGGCALLPLSEKVPVDGAMSLTALIVHAVLAPALWAVMRREGQGAVGVPVGLVAATSALLWLAALLDPRDLPRDEGYDIFLVGFPFVALTLVLLCAALATLFGWAVRSYRRPAAA